MLEKYKDVIENLSANNRQAVIKALYLPNYSEHLYDVLEEFGRSQADVALALLRAGTPEALAGAEALIGRPVKRCPPSLIGACPELSIYAQAQWVLSLLGPETGANSDGRRVTRLIQNPRLPTTPSWGRFRLLKIGMTVGQFLVRGGTRKDVRLWVREGSIELSSA